MCHLLAIAIEQIHIMGFCILGVLTKCILQIKSIVQVTPYRQTHTKLYTGTMFRTGRSKTIREYSPLGKYHRKCIVIQEQF